jgi:hypothetical protein
VDKDISGEVRVRVRGRVKVRVRVRVREFPVDKDIYDE